MIVLALVLLAWIGNSLVLHNFPLSNDEFLPRFQAQIFMTGQIKAFLPPELREFGKALTPIFAIFDPQEGTWVSSYLPIYAAATGRVPGTGGGVLDWSGSGGLSLVLIAAVARRLWPQEPLAPFIAVILLASSTQFLITSMTSYAYPAHLCFNLAWLYFYCRGDRLGNLGGSLDRFFCPGPPQPICPCLVCHAISPDPGFAEKLAPHPVLRFGLWLRVVSCGISGGPAWFFLKLFRAERLSSFLAFISC